MSFQVSIISLMLCLWVVSYLPLLGFYCLEGKLGKVYDMAIVFMALTFIIVAVVVFVYKDKL